MKTDFLLLLLLLAGTGSAQTAGMPVRFEAKDHRIIIESYGSSLSVEGTDGHELIIEPMIAVDAKPTQGLTLLSGKEPDLPLTVKREVVLSDKLLAITLPAGNCRNIRIKVPRYALLKVNFHDESPEGKMSFKNLSGELEIGGTARTIDIDAVAGPLTLFAGTERDRVKRFLTTEVDENGVAKTKSTFSLTNAALIQETGISEKISITHIQWTSSASPKNAFNIISGMADVDISLPQDMMANVQVDSQYGELYSDLPLVKLMSATEVKNRFVGELNGGGVQILVSTTQGNVYVRKQRP